MTQRTCLLILPDGKACDLPAEWELLPSTAVYEHVDACTAHVGELLDDAPETRVTPIKQA